MGITANMTPKNMSDDFRKKVEETKQLIRDSFEQAGWTAVRDARDQVQDHASGTYIDRTKNLRGSVSYYSFENGELMNEFASEFAEENKAQISKGELKQTGISLVLMAGKSYATHVEGYGYNVLTKQAYECDERIEKYLKAINSGLH
jgi:hypothetical protein